MTKESLFSEFSKVSAKEWKQKIQYDLKGKDYNDVLVWEALEGIKVKPFYSEDDLDSETRFKTPNHSWQIAEDIYVSDVATANQKALQTLKDGAESLLFTIEEQSVAWDVLLKEIDLRSTPVHFKFNFLDSKTVMSLLNFTDGKEAEVYLNIDLIGNLAQTGNWYENQKTDHEHLETLHTASQNNPGVHLLSVNATLYQNAGANMIQQLAYALAHANEYLAHFEDVVSKKEDKSFPMVFKVSLGSNYFFEIAKLRALRWLWRTVASEYGFENNCHIVAFPSKRNKCIYDYNVNQLRSTMECMSAVLGGADTINNLPYDALYKKDNVFSERIARNQLLVLKTESYFSEVSRAVDGTYYIENLTNELAEKALQLFKQLEKGGGFLAQLKSGKIQKKIQESAAKERQLFDSGDLTAVGCNKYQNEKDKMQQELELYPFIKTKQRKTMIEPIIEKRLAEGLEKERLESEKSK